MGRDNVLLVTAGALRADRLGCYGHHRPTSPHMDKLAGQGALFENAFSQSNIATASHATIFTGLFPKNHGVLSQHRQKLDASVPTLAHILGRAGYRTGAAVGVEVLNPDWCGLGAGFETYLGVEKNHRSSEDTADGLLEWIESVHTSRFFAWVHLSDIRPPYTPPSPYDRMFYSGDEQDPALPGIAGYDLPAGQEAALVWLDGVRDSEFIQAQYDAAVCYVDSVIGKLVGKLDQLGQLDKTLIVITADHGESLGEHRVLLDHRVLYDQVMHVPLIMSSAKLAERPRRVPGLAMHVDVVPTILDLVGVRQQEPLNGKSLAPLIRGDRAQVHNAVFAETHKRIQASIRTERWKLIKTIKSCWYTPESTPKSGDLEFYDLLSDPGETRNLVEENPAKLEVLQSMLETWLEGGNPPAGDLRWSSIGHNRDAQRLVLLGLDGIDPSLVYSLASDGSLPNFARLFSQGARASLQMRHVPAAASSWYAIVNGKLPAGRRDDGPLWRVLNAGGKAVGLINVPDEPSLRSSAGSCVARAPGSLLGEASVVLPEAMRGDLAAGHTGSAFLAGPWRAVQRLLLADPAAALSAVGDAFSTSLRIFWKLFYRPFETNDETEHLLYCMFPECEMLHLLGRRPDGTATQVLLEYYSNLDALLGELLDRAHDGVQVAIISTYAARPTREAIDLRAWLVKRGFIRYEGDSVLSHVGIGRRYRPEVIPSPARTKLVPGSVVADDGSLVVPHRPGVQAPPDQAEYVMALLRDELNRLTDRRTGRAPVLGAHLGDKLYPNDPNAADVYVEVAAEYAFASVGQSIFSQSGRDGAPFCRREPVGLFIAAGEGIDANEHPTALSPLDTRYLVQALVGLAPDPAVDPLIVDFLGSRYLDRVKIASLESIFDTVQPDLVDEAQMLAKLKALGYVT